MNRFEFYDRYRLFIPITHLRQFERDLQLMVHEEVTWERERALSEEYQRRS